MTSPKTWLHRDGRIIAAFAPDRPRSATAPILPTPCRGRCSDYRRTNDRCHPFAGEVAWEVDGWEIVDWQGRLKHWDTVSIATAPRLGKEPTPCA